MNIKERIAATAAKHEGAEFTRNEMNALRFIQKLHNGEPAANLSARSKFKM